MLFWMMAGAITLIVALVLLRAVARARGLAAGPAPAAPTADMQVYRDQMAEVERDLARGTIAPDEAARLRAEVGRRLLEADRAASATAPTASAPATPARPAAAGPLVVLAAAVIIGGSAAMYLWLGAPGYPDLPLADRLAEADARMAARPAQAEAVAEAPPLPPAPAPDPDFAALMDKLRATLAERPDDPRGLELLARNEAALGNLEAAEAAQGHLLAVRGDGSQAADHAFMAEILIRRAGGYISPEAEAQLVSALQRDPKNGMARYFSGLLFAQGGRFDRAFILWRGLLEEDTGLAPDQAPWIAAVRDQMPDVAERAGVRYSLPEAPKAADGLRGPDAADVEAAAGMEAADRQAMIEGMVAQLSDRLAAEGGSVEEWARLIRAQGVLQRADDAAKTYAAAQAAFAGQDSALSFLKEAAVEAGLAP